jgi:YbbR domain-containing protein
MKLGHNIDKYIIVPITKLALFIKDVLTKDSKKFEKIMGQKRSLLLITLILAIAIFIAVDSKTIAMIETSAEVLYNQPVIVQYNEEAYVLEGVPEKVDITLIGRNFDLYLAKQISVHEITLDLSGLKPGVHKVALKYKRALDTINYKLDPSVVTVTIYPKISQAKTVYVDLLNADNLDPKLIVEKTDIDRDEVIVKGSEDTLKRVSTIKALIDANNFIDPKVGKLELQDVPLIAYDQSGNVINAEIVPSKINAIVTIASPQKTIPIRFVPTGTIISLGAS